MGRGVISRLGDRLTALVGGPTMVVTLIVASTFFMENLDATIIVTALPDMAESFGVDPTRMGLGITAYMLAVAALIPLSGWLADRVGAKTLFVSAIGVFTLASVACAIAPNFHTFIGARILQGAAAAMMSPVGRLVVLRSAQQKDMLRALSTLVWPALFAPVIGPPLGGWITSAADWRWIFYVNVPLGLIGMGLVMAFVPNQKAGERSPFDARGFLLMAVALGLLTYGLDLVGVREAGSFGLGLVLVATSLVLGWLSYRHAQRTPEPVVRLDALKIRTFFVSSVSGGLISRATISATPFLLPLMFQLGYGMSPVASGSLLLIYMLANLAMKTVTTPLLRRFGIRNILIWNGLLSSAAIAACALVSPAMPLAANGAILLAAGATRSMQLTAVTMITFADVGPEQRSPASVLFSLAQQIGMGMGVAVGALMLNFSELIRQAPALGVFDFRVALVLAGVLSALATIPYAGLDRDAGDALAGRKAAA